MGTVKARGSFIAAILVAAAACGGDDPPGGMPIDPVLVKVMTRNLYLGADLLPVVTADSTIDLSEKAGVLWKTVQEADFPARAKLLADEIAAARPDLVGLQEVELFRIQTPSDYSFDAPVVNASAVSIDFLALLQTELGARGLDYVVAVEHTNADVELPARAADGGGLIDVRLTDRDVILAARRVELAAAEATQYPSHLPFRIPLSGPVGAPVKLVRGLSRVQATIGAARFLFANTHLEVPGGPQNVLTMIQEGQARDLVNALQPARGPVILVGDFNSAATGRDTRSYTTVAASFTDAHTALALGDSGGTCCTALESATFTGRSRIDIVFIRGPVRAQTVEVIGKDPTKKTPDGLWPSDHAGVVATLSITGT